MGTPDPVGAAVGKVDRPAVQLRQLQVTIASTGRPAILAIPADITDGEIAELAGWMLTGLLNTLRTERSQPGARLVIARGTVPRM